MSKREGQRQKIQASDTPDKFQPGKLKMSGIMAFCI
jgi:hypothetical protein